MLYPVEDTAGSTLDYTISPLPPSPFLRIAKKWGLRVHQRFYVWAYGACTNEGDIYLSSPEPYIFAHELAHAASLRIFRGEERLQKPLREIVAELSALCVGIMTGTKVNIGNSYDFISAYAEILFPELPGREGVREATTRIRKRTCAVVESIAAKIA